jgi:hypothetical protein
MTGVTSNDLYAFSTPFDFKGSRGYPCCAVGSLLLVKVAVEVLVAMIDDIGMDF